MLQWTRKPAYILADLLLVNGAFIGSLLLRFDGVVPEHYIQLYLRYGFFLSAIALIVFTSFNLYNNLWQYASIYEIINIVMAVSLFTFISWVFFLLVPGTLPRSIFVMVWCILLISVGGIRLIRRFRYPWRQFFTRHNGKSSYNLLIIGAGQAGSLVIKELFDHPELGSPAAILDEDPLKKGCRIHGVPVVGTLQDLDKAVTKYHVNEILVAIPSAPETEVRRILYQCKETGCKLKRLPGIFSIIDGKISIRQMRDVNIADLLGRPEVSLDMDSICSYIQDQVVLVTGAGGSIGSELCRQIAGFAPKQLVMLDNYENNLYQLQLELLHTFPQLQLNTLIGSVQDEMRIDSILAKYQPQVIFHAAAHKHVPLMEDSPSEAIKNNIFGTINVAKSADRHNVRKFIFISTDKAVNPTSVMGASKRVAEMAIQQINKFSKTKFAAVRFGNVLGSNGSVIPIFQKQIARGGPVTVTHPEITRYFMTIPEAAQLVIQAGALAQGGEVFILDMGEPIKILDLAKDLIALSGYKPDVDIKIQFTGLRPGEKMYEELLLDKETADKTSHDKIFICRSSEGVNELKQELRFLEKVLCTNLKEYPPIYQLLNRQETVLTEQSSG
jgi:FlaA1/EpsC-like NDP-sugar epimerase